jgi:ectoine hydroxylase-related dioxygenase (phytanoyl-CoA dioxygenase family)
MEEQMPEVLTRDQIDFYDDNGYLVLENRVPDGIMVAVRAEIARFEQMARGMTASDDKIDLEDTHKPDAPRIRRVKLPNTQSRVIDDLLHSDHVLAPVRDLIGPNLRLQTSKLNMKSAGYGAAVEWHQDWAFYPYTNDDVLAVGVIIDDMTPENGPLMVFPGSHKGPVYDHHHNGVFAGAMDVMACGFDMQDAVPLMGPAGSISIHHARIVHGSALNRSTRDRRIIFFEMMAADAFPIAGSRMHYKSLEEFNARMLCGEPTLEPRLAAVPARIPYPEAPNQGSIYEVQKAMGRRSFEVAEQ